MPKVKFKSRLLADGHLYCPHRIVEDLKLQIGSQLEVIVEKETDQPFKGRARNFISLRNSIPELSAITETEFEETKKLWNSKIDKIADEL